VTHSHFGQKKEKMEVECFTSPNLIRQAAETEVNNTKWFYSSV